MTRPPSSFCGAHMQVQSWCAVLWKRAASSSVSLEVEVLKLWHVTAAQSPALLQSPGHAGPCVRLDLYSKPGTRYQAGVVLLPAHGRTAFALRQCGGLPRNRCWSAGGLDAAPRHCCSDDQIAPGPVGCLIRLPCRAAGAGARRAWTRGGTASRSGASGAARTSAGSRPMRPASRKVAPRQDAHAVLQHTKVLPVKPPGTSPSPQKILEAHAGVPEIALRKGAAF